MKKNVLLLLTFLLCFPLVGFSENIIFENVTWSPTYIEAALANGSLEEKTANSMRNYKFSLKIDDSKVSAFDKIGALKDPDDYYKSSYFQKEIKNDNYDIVILSLDPNAMPTIQERANSIMFSKSGDYIFYEYRKQGAYVLYEIPTNESNLKAWNRLIKMISDKNKIEPYQSNSKNKMIYNGIIVAEDNEIYEGGFVPVFIELEKKKQSNTGTDNIIVKIKDRGTSELYYHGEFNKDSKLVVKKDYLLIKGNSGSSSLEVKNNEDWDFVIETSLMTGKILKKYIIAIEDATQEDFSSIISFFKQ